VSEPDRPNFFILLELDPAAPWDEQEYQRALSKAKGAWSRDSMGLQSLPKTGAAKLHLSLVRTIVAVMADPALREKERANARSERAAADMARRKDLEEHLALMLTRGYLLEQEVSGLRDEFADILSVDPDLAQRLDRAEVHGTQADGFESRLSPAKESQLRDWLVQLNASSIYDVLRSVDSRVTNSSPLRVLIVAADELYKQAHLVANKNDPSIVARQRLSGLAKQIFESEEERRRHDVSMKVVKVQSLIDRIEQVLGIARAVTPGQFEWFLERAKTIGADDLDLVKDYFLAHFRVRGWAIEVLPAGAEEALRRKVQCPRCAQLNEPAQQACLTCGFVLREPCPSCGMTAPRYGGGCSCGFPIAQRDLVEDLLGQARSALGEHELAQAEVLVERAGRIWDLPTGKSDSISASIRMLRAELSTAQQELRSAQVAIQQLVSQRQYIAAEKSLQAAPANLPGRAELLQQAKAAIREARGHYRAAQRNGTTRAQQIELYAEALRVCADIDVARAELARIPPEPPTGVRAKVSDPSAGVRISWQASSDREVSYVVVRGTGQAPPATIENLPDQARLGTTERTSWRDRDTADLTGLPLTYAVFTERSGTVSAPGVADAVVIMAESELQAQLDDAQVILTWHSPPRVADVKVTRQEVARPDVQVSLAVREPGRLVDPDVQIGARYRYTIRTAYTDLSGGLCWTTGSSAEITPAERPAPPGRLLVRGSQPAHPFYEHKVWIWSLAAERGVLRVVRQDGIGSLREGAELPESKLRFDGQMLAGSPPMTDYWIEREPSLRSYMPVLLLDGVAYVGAARRYALAAEVSDLQAEFVAGVVRVGWNWPGNSDQVLVGHGSSRDLFDPTGADQHVRAGRADGERAGGCSIPVEPGCAQLDLVVGAIVKRDGVEFITSGAPLHIDRPGTRISYEVRSLPRHRRELTLRHEGPVEMPATVLRGRAGGTPLTRDDGEAVATFGPMRLTGRRVLPLPRSGQPGFGYRLFTSSVAEASAVELVPH
jgi:hypothetical protein